MSLPLLELIAKLGVDMTAMDAGLSTAQSKLTAFASGITSKLNAGGVGVMASLGSGLTKVGGQAMQAGTALTAGFTLPMAGLIKAGADFDSMLSHVANNTSLTSKEIDSMKTAVISMGKESGSSFTQLAEGFMHITNFGFSAKDSVVLLRAAMESANATGGDVGKTAEILANVMHEFSMPVTEAAKAMNMLHVEANKGNMTLEALVEAGGPAFAMAANLGISINETAAAMAALTQHGFSAAEAATQVRNILAHIAEPAAHARQIIDELSKSTGVDLVRDFSIAGLHAKGMSGVLDDIALAAHRSGMGVSDLAMKLIPAMRGGIGAMALAGTASKDFHDRLMDAADAMSGKLAPTTAQYAKQQATLTAGIERAKNELITLGIEIERTLLPALKPLIEFGIKAVKMFESLPAPVQKGIIILAGITAVVGPLLLVLGSMATGIGSIITLATTLGPVLIAVGAALTGPVGLAIAATVAALAGLAVAWKNDFGGIQEKTAAFVDWIKPFLSGAMGFLQNTFSGVWGNIVGVFRGVWDILVGVVKVGWGLIAGVVTVGLSLLQGHWKEAWDYFLYYGKMILGGLYDIVSGGLRGIGNLFLGWGKVALNWAKELIMGMVNGIKNGVGVVVESVKHLASSIVTTVKDTLGIHSPSAVFQEIGKNIGDGAVAGIEGCFGSVTDAASQLGAQAQTGMFNSTRNIRNIMSDAAVGFKDTFTNVLGDLYNTGIKGFFNNLIGGFQQTLDKMASDYLASKISSLFTGLLGSLGGATGGGGGMAPGTLSGTLGFDGALADGGAALSGRSYLVGERGPELFTPGTSGTVTPNGAAGNITIHNYITTPDVNSFNRSQGQIGAEMARKLQMHQTRNR